MTMCALVRTRLVSWTMLRRDELGARRRVGCCADEGAGKNGSSPVGLLRRVELVVAVGAVGRLIERAADKWR